MEKLRKVARKRLYEDKIRYTNDTNPKNITILPLRTSNLFQLKSVPDLYTISSEHRTCGYVKPKAKFAVMSLQT